MCDSTDTWAKPGNANLHPIAAAEGKTILTFIPYLLHGHWMVALIIDHPNKDHLGVMENIDVVVYDPSYADDLAPVEEVKKHLGEFVSILTEIIASCRMGFNLETAMKY